MCAEDVGRVECARDVVEAQDSGGDTASRLMTRECVVLLVQLGMGHGGGVHDRLIVAKHHGRVCHTSRHWAWLIPQ